MKTFSLLTSAFLIGLAVANMPTGKILPTDDSKSSPSQKTLTRAPLLNQSETSFENGTTPTMRDSELATEDRASSVHSRKEKVRPDPIKEPVL